MLTWWWKVLIILILISSLLVAIFFTFGMLLVDDLKRKFTAAPFEVSK